MHWINWIQCLKKLNRIQIYDKHFLSNFNKNQVYKKIANTKVLINQDKLNTQTNWHIYWIAKLVMATGLLNEKRGLENFPTATIAISNSQKCTPHLFQNTWFLFLIILFVRRFAINLSTCILNTQKRVKYGLCWPFTSMLFTKSLKFTCMLPIIPLLPNTICWY